jgi:hypothetical protein
MERLRHETGLQLIALLAIAFVAVQWGSRDVRFGVVILFVAFVAFLAGNRRTRAKVSQRDAAWIASLGGRERELRTAAASIEHDDIEQAVDYERRANAVQQAHYAALDTVRGRA